MVGGRGPAIFVTSLDNPETSDRNVIAHNVANSTLYDGILVIADATGTLIRRNHRESQPRPRIEAVLGVTDGGGNRAFGNGNPQQCTNVACGRR